MNILSTIFLKTQSDDDIELNINNNKNKKNRSGFPFEDSKHQLN